MYSNPHLGVQRLCILDNEINVSLNDLNLLDHMCAGETIFIFVVTVATNQTGDSCVGRMTRECWENWLEAGEEKAGFYPNGGAP